MKIIIINNAGKKMLVCEVNYANRGFFFQFPIKEYQDGFVKTIIPMD